MRSRVRVRAKGAVGSVFSTTLPADRPRSPRSCRAWSRDLRSGTAFAALFAVGLFAAIPTSHAQELPTGGTVTHGDATISGSGSGLLIDQTSGSAIISWETFSVGTGGTTHFNNGSGATLNRVSGNVPSSIDGSLTATGSLYLINPAGVTVGTGGMVATGGTFAASTHDVTDRDFLDGGDTVFAGGSKADIVNHGTISSAMGDVALIARRVENTGEISAPNGTAALLAGYDVLMHETTGPNGKFVVRAGGSDTEAVNSGVINAAEAELRANGGNVLALAGNTKGVITATGVARSGGRIFLTAGGGKVQTSGRVTARRRVSAGSSQQSGGEVFINADTVLASGHIDVSGLGAAGGNIDMGGRDVLLQGATLDASGDAGGGRIRVGGAFQGGNFGWLRTADTTTVDAKSLLTANAIENGDGGEVIVWADGTTLFDGTIDVRGGAQGGDGGLAETSGLERLWVGQNAFVTALAPHGTTGDWLFDPRTITVATGGAASLAQAADSTDTTSDITIDPTTINGAAANVTLWASETITFTDAVSMTGAGVGLTARAGDEVNVDASITTNNGDITFLTDDPEIRAAVNAGNGTISFELLTPAVFGIGAEVGAGVGLTVGELQNLSGGTLQIGNANSAGNNVTGVALFNTIDLSTAFSLVRYNTLNGGNSGVSIGSGVDHTYAAMEVFANGGVISIGDAVITTTVGDISIFGDEDLSNSGNGLRTQGLFSLVSAGDIFINANNVSETGGGEISLTANGGAGTIQFSRAAAGTIGVGNGAPGDMHFSDGELSRMSAATINFGDGANTSEINVDGGDFTGLGTFGFTTTAGGAVNFADSTENYAFDAMVANTAANLGANVTTTAGQTYNGAVTLTANAVVSDTNGGDIAFNSTIDGLFNLTVNTSGNTLFDGDIGTSTRLGDITTDAAGTTTLRTLTLRTSGALNFNDPVAGIGGLVIDSNQGGANTTFASTVDGGDWIITEPSTLTFGGAVGGTTPLVGLQLNSPGGTVNINGGLVRTANLMRLRGNLVFDSATDTTTLESTNDGEIRLGENASNSVRSATDGEESLTIRTGGSTLVRGVIGDNNQRFNSITTDAGGTTFLAGGSLTLSGNTLTFNDAVMLNADTVISDAGDVTFNSTIDGAFGLTVNSGGTAAFNDAVGGTTALTGLSVQSDDVTIAGAIDVGAGIVTLAPLTAGRTIDLGTETAGSLSLTDAELDLITAGTLRIGSAGAGSISITNSISPANTSILSLTTGDQILDNHNLNAADIVVANLALRAVNGIADNDGLDTEVETLAVLNTTDNSVSVLERSSGGSLTIGTVDGLTGVVNQGSGPHPGQRSIQIETNDGDLTIAAGSEVTSSHGGIYLVAQHQNGGTGDRLFTNNGAITMEGGNGRIEIIANNMNLGSVAGGSSISSLNGSRIVLSDDPSSLSTIAINLGGADGVNTLGLTQTELATVSTSGVLQIGHAGSGDITASGVIDFDAANVETLSLQTGGAVLDGNQITFDPITVANLAIRAGNGIGSAADDLDLVVSNLAFSNAAGVVNVENAAPLTIAAVDGLSNSDNSGTTTTLIAGLGILQALNIDVDISSAGAALFTGGSIVVGSDVDISAASADFDAASIALNGNGVTTTGDQDYRGAVTLGADNVLTSSASGAINFASTVDGGSGLTVNTAGNTTFVGAVGGATQLADLTTDAGGTTFVNGGLVATTGSQTFNDQVSVAGTVFASTGGSLTFGAGITTTLPDSSLWLLAADDIDIGRDVQWDGTGDVTLVAGWNAATDGSTGWTIGSTTADTTLLDDAGNFGQGTGDISIGTTAQTAGVSVGSRDGTTTALAQNMYLASSASDDGYAQLGFRGAATGDIAVVLTEDLTTLTGAGLRSFVQIGHGGHNDDNDHSGDISIDVGEGVLLSGGGNTQSYGLFGHGGYGSDGAKSGAIDLTIGGILTVSGGAGTDAFAQIGHGDISGNSSGTRMGDISAIVGGRTNFTASSGSYWFGHATSTGGGISNANVALVTNGLSFAGLTPATGPTAASGDFAQMIRNNLTGGDVLIANRLAQIADADSGNPDYLDDIIFFGDDADFVVESDNSIFFAATGEVSFEHGLQIDGTGGINLVAGWDGTTGLDLSGFPALSMTDIEAAGAFGSSTGSEGDNGDINIREFNPTGRILVGSWMGDIHALAHDLEVTAGPADGAESRLGAWPQANVDIDSDIRIVVKDDVLVLGGDGDRSIAAIGHGFGDGFGNISGDIAILGENDANDNEIVVAGGDGEFSVARIGHDSLGGEAHGDILLRGEDISVEGGSDDDAFAQIGHIGELVTGKLDIEATNDLEVLGGSDDGAHAQIGHKSASATGDLTVTVGGNLAIIGGDDEFTFAQIGHIGETATGSIDIDVAGLAILLGGFDEVADAQIGHDAEDLASGAIDFTVGGPLIIAALTEDAFAYVGHSGDTNAAGDIKLDVGDSLIMGTLGDFTAAQIGHIADADNTGDTKVAVDGAIFLGNVADGSYTKIGHGNWSSDGALSGDIDVTSVGPIMLYGGLFGDSFTQFGHGDPFGFSDGTRRGDITVITDGEMTLDDGLAAGSLAWVGHGTATAGGTSDADVFLQAFGFDRDLPSTVPAGDLGRFNKDILEANIPFGDFTLVATGTGLLVEDPVYNSPFQLLMSVNNDMVLNTNAIFVNSGTGNIILAAGGDFHNDTGTLTPFTTGGRWLVYSTRPDNNRNDIEIANWDFLRYSTTFDLNNPLVGTGNGLVYSVTPVVNFAVSDETISYGQTPALILSRVLTVNGVNVDPLAFGLGISPATADTAIATFVALNGFGQPLPGFYPDSLVTRNEFLPYFGMAFTRDPGNLMVTGTTSTTGNPISISTNSGIGGMCAFRSDDEDPEEEGPAFDRIIELCGIIESDRD